MQKVKNILEYEEFYLFYKIFFMWKIVWLDWKPLDWISQIDKLDYCNSNFDWLTLETLKDFNSFLYDVLNWEWSIFWVSGFAWAWKSVLEKQILELFSKKVFRTKKNKKWEPLLNDEWWKIFTTWHEFNLEWKDLSILFAWLDWFFSAIGDSKYWNILLKDRKSFEQNYADNIKILKYFSKFLRNNEAFSEFWIYSKGLGEREKEQWAWEIIVPKRPKKNKKFVLVDWVNSHHIIRMYEDILLNKIKINKVLIKPDLFRAFCRIMIRDIIWTEKKPWRWIENLDKIVKFRLVETFYILDFILDSFEKKDFTMFNYSHPFSNIENKDFINKIIESLNKNRDILLETDLFPELKKFVEQYSEFLIDRFSQK